MTAYIPAVFNGKIDELLDEAMRGVSHESAWSPASNVWEDEKGFHVQLALPGWDMSTIFLPQIIIGFGNGLLLPTSVAGAVSIRPQVAGTASGLTGFIQMAIGAAAAQLGGLAVAHATDAVPLLLLMLAFGVATAVAVFTLVRR